MEFDELLERCPASVRDGIAAARRDWASASEEARAEVRAARRGARPGRRVLGEGAVRIVSIAEGAVLTGDETVERTVTEALEDLTARALAVEGEHLEVVRGVGSTFANLYEYADRYGPYLERMSRDAFNESLRLPDLQCSMCREHEGMGMATTRGGRHFLDTDDTGLLFAAAVDVREADASELVLKLRNGSTPADTSVGAGPRGYSIEWSDDYLTGTILRWSLSRGEVSVLRAGANPGGWAEVVDRDAAEAEADRAAAFERELLELDETV